MSFVNLNLAAFFANETYGEDRWSHLAEFIERRLSAISSTLMKRGLIFEAGEADALREMFERFAAFDGSPENFATCWHALEDWASTTIIVGNRERGMCSIGKLPSRFCC